MSYEELADLQAGLLTAEQEERLRMRMERDPDAARRMLADLALVDATFPVSVVLEEPTEVPPAVAARWQSVIAAEAERRARGERASFLRDSGLPDSSRDPGSE